MTILHLAPAAEWAASAGRPYAPGSLATEGFVHCTAGPDRLLRVANLFYRELPGPFVAVELDETRLTSEVRWEGPAGGAPAGDEHELFPHVYGPLDPAAVVAVLPVSRAADGTFTGIGSG